MRTYKNTSYHADQNKRNSKTIMQVNWSLALSKIKDELNKLLRYALYFASIKLEMGAYEIKLVESGLTFSIAWSINLFHVFIKNVHYKSFREVTNCYDIWNVVCLYYKK